jgi:hypothetical protein
MTVRRDADEQRWRLEAPQNAPQTCRKCRREEDRAYALAVDDRRTTLGQALAIVERKPHLCNACAAETIGADSIGRRNAYDGTPWTHAN